MTQKEILKLLSEEDIPFVLIGGVAMRIHNSPRVTHDIDLAVRILDVDRIIDVLYPRSYYLVTEIQTNSVLVMRDPGEAKTWIEKSKAGSASFLQTRNPPKDDADYDDIRFLEKLLKNTHPPA